MHSSIHNDEGRIMFRNYILAVAFLGVAACSTSGSELPATGEQAEASVKSGNQTVAQDGSELSDPEEFICTKERLTGSRIPTKVCLTRAERERLQKQSQAYMEKDRRKPGSNPTQ
jgi:hypothetical protein